MNRSDVEETSDGLGLDIEQEELAVATTGLAGGVADELADHSLTCSTSNAIRFVQGIFPSNTTMFRSIGGTFATEQTPVQNRV
ncbi:hypothetical protein [Roseiconus lacunae]|uniref:Uncharacterized protein n=1 Tax=Roseiconus lacunae TaxID=2605694 RepID=A0ABT7PCN0_9BACT|nr:hypothetical protein [Roseiconus lacunae]MDM4014226.1 hypothetical protein [Roseiconus lacunae]